MVEIETVADSPSITGRGHAFPALERGNISFPVGRYVVGFEPGADACSFTVHHRIEGAQMISSAIEKGLAQFVCTVASPLSSYRFSHVSETSIHAISWKTEDLGEPPLFTPMVVVARPFGWKLSQQQDGVHTLWDGRKVIFEPGMRLALSDVVHMRASVMSMLRFKMDNELSEGEFRVEAEAREGFQFLVRLAPALHRFLHYDTGDERRAHIVTHIVSACFGVLKADYAEDEEEEGGWRSFRGLQAMAELLETNGLPHWSEEDFSPEHAATRLFPHRVDRSPDAPEED